MKPTEIAFVCYAVNDMKRARKFYEGVLGLKPGSTWIGEDMGFIEYEIGPHTLAIGKGAQNFKVGMTGGTVALEVEDFEKATETVKKAGVQIIMEPYESPICHMMLIADGEGNQVMIHKRKAK